MSTGEPGGHPVDIESTGEIQPASLEAQNAVTEPATLSEDVFPDHPGAASGDGTSEKAENKMELKEIPQSTVETEEVFEVTQNE